MLLLVRVHGSIQPGYTAVFSWVFLAGSGTQQYPGYTAVSGGGCEMVAARTGAYAKLDRIFLSHSGEQNAR